MSVVRIDLDAFSANLAEIGRRVAPAEHMLVVKDDAYGHGLEEICRRAAQQGVRWYGAFDVRTARQVRAVLGDGPRVFVWLLGSGEAEAAVAMGLDIGVGDAAMLEEVAAAAAASGSVARVHLKVDTGLHRNGVRPEDWAAFVVRAAQLDSVCVVGIWSHIAEASEAEDDTARVVFEWAADRARSAGLRPELLHLAASAASFTRAEFRYDLVRVGAFAYGIRPAGGPGEAELGIRPIARFEAPVTIVGAGVVEIGVGALDGLPSTLAGRVEVGTPGGPLMLREIGDTSSTVSGWREAAIGDIVVVFGPGDSGERSATALGEAIDTIGEEVWVRVSPWVPRDYR